MGCSSVAGRSGYAIAQTIRAQSFDVLQVEGGSAFATALVS
jgi:hypothetical protein